MANTVRTAALLTFVLCWSGGWLNVVNGGDVDISILVPCGVNNPPENNRVCYRTDVDDPCNPTTCQATELTNSNFPISFIGTPQQAKIWSPGNLRGRNYQNRRLCRYLAACPPGSFLYYQWNNGNFNLELPDPNIGCVDHILLSTGLEECGAQEMFSDEIAVPLGVEFRSNTVNRFLGFQMDLLCVSPLLEASASDGGAAGMQAWMKYSSVQQSQCREVPDPNPYRPRDRQGSPKYIWPPTDYRIQVPRRAAIRYHRNVIRISFRRVLKTFRHIKKLIFWTGFNGTQIFVRNAPPGLLFGGGILKVYKYVAHYWTDRIPPRFEPNSEERRLISVLLNATRPFFVDQDVGDIDLPNDTMSTTPPPTVKPTRYPISPAKYPNRPRKYPSYYKPAYRSGRSVYYPYYQKVDSRVDLRALKLAQTYDNACNIFLRGAAESFLSILDEMGIQPRRKKFKIVKP